MLECNNTCTVVITTFFAGDKLENCIKNIPHIFKILIIDNGGEKNKKIYFENKFPNLTYFVSNENLGVPRSSSLGNKMVKLSTCLILNQMLLSKKNVLKIY